MIKFKVYDSNGWPVEACKTLKQAEKALAAYIKRTGAQAYIKEVKNAT